MWRKGRARGSFATSNAKLTSELVQEIRRESWAGEASRYELADKYGVHNSTIANIVNCKTWAKILTDEERELFANRLDAPKGRAHAHYTRKLTIAQKWEIKRLFATRSHSQKELGEMFGVCRSSISQTIKLKLT